MTGQQQQPTTTMNAGPADPWHLAFAKVINCTRCTKETDKNLLRDAGENVPQPGYIGARYDRKRLLLVGQNPAAAGARIRAMDRNYTAALRTLRGAPTEQNYAVLQSVLDAYIPEWPVHGQHFPLRECDLDLADIAYCNLVRCRTITVGSEATVPHNNTAERCGEQHFERWLDKLNPKAVVFIGKWASDPERGGGMACAARGIPWTVKLRGHLTTQVRDKNIRDVVDFVRKYIHRTE